MDTYRTNDFASDRLLLDLVSFETMNKIAMIDKQLSSVTDPWEIF